MKPILFIAFAATLAAQNFIQMSDPQFGMFTKDASGRRPENASGLQVLGDRLGQVDRDEEVTARRGPADSRKQQLRIGIAASPQASAIHALSKGRRVTSASFRKAGMDAAAKTRVRATSTMNEESTPVLRTDDKGTVPINP